MSMYKGFRTLFIVSLIGLAVAFFWDHLPSIRSTVHVILNPSAGYLLNWDPSWGLLIISCIISLITTILQKYMTDQETLKSLRAEQKVLNQQMKEYKEHPEKVMELQRKQMPLVWKSMEISMRPALFTAIPFILLIRWFGDYFADNPSEIFGFMSWFWAYVLFAVVSSIALRKIFKLP